MQNNGKEFPKNLPDDIGRDKNILTMSSTAGDRGDVSSKIGIGLDAHFEGGERRRRPKSHGLLKGLLAYFSAAILVIGILVIVFWRFAEIGEASRAELFVDNFIAESDVGAWQQQLRLNLPATYPDYEDASRLAYEVLSPALKLGKITHMRRILPTAEGYPVFEIFSDGRHFASLVIKDTSVGVLSMGEWEIERIEFDITYFDNVDFPEYRVTVPAGATLTVNGVAIDPAHKERERVPYPALTAVEQGNAVAPCDLYIFNDVYFLPELGATLDGKELELAASEGSEFFFYYPEDAVHTVSVIVPVGVDAYVSGILLTEKWAQRSEIDGELGDLDDGGTGTLPRLSVWTIENVFGEVEVEAKIGEKSLELLSSEGGTYKFATPEECQYTVTVILPSGAELIVNGKTVSPERKEADGATAEDIAYGFTALGRYEVSELGVIEGAVPAFDKYILSGYLAEPNIAAKLNGTELPLAGKSLEGYSLRAEFDFGTGDVFDAERIAAAERFAEAYIAYVCGGGAWNDPANEKAFNENYKALKAQMIEGTAGYVAVMESYREVNLLPKYDSFTVDSKNVTNLVAYTEKSLSCSVEFNVTRTRTVDGVAQTEAFSVSISVLQVLYNGEWRVWSFVYLNKNQ